MPDEMLMLDKFLENVRGTVPLGVGEIDCILRLIEAAEVRVERVLDLDCGGGVVGGALRDEYPEARLVTLPATPTERYEHPRWRDDALNQAPYDLITSGVELPLLPDARQRPFFSEVRELLRPGGLFLTVQYVACVTRFTESPWDDRWIEAVFGDVLREEKGRPRGEVAREWYERLASRHRVAPLEVQCEWLRELGFESVDCFLKVNELAVFGGLRPHGA